eukprot:TRINITY_DN5102_c0_g1_i2.p1 TRINITY_DN5102_c0_g1~~TRINITY_DN5102_c0_g1_i2.p1  ORF type:complete len:975 (+),score=296.16 TRINITY_DN5102_c0_g1_i2:77-3001(+)
MAEDAPGARDYTLPPSKDAGSSNGTTWTSPGPVVLVLLTKRGILEKEDQGKYEKRLGVLRGNRLALYTNKEDPLEFVEDVTLTSEVIVSAVPSKTTCFQIQIGDKVKNFAATSVAERDSWIEVLDQSRSGNGASPSVSPPAKKEKDTRKFSLANISNRIHKSLTRSSDSPPKVKHADKDNMQTLVRATEEKEKQERQESEAQEENSFVNFDSPSSSPMLTRRNTFRAADARVARHFTVDDLKALQTMSPDTTKKEADVAYDPSLIKVVNVEIVSQVKRANNIKTDLICKVHLKNATDLEGVVRSLKHFNELQHKLELMFPGVAKEIVKVNPLPRIKDLAGISPDEATRQLQQFLDRICTKPEHLESSLMASFVDPLEKPLLMALRDTDKEGPLKMNTGIMTGFAERWIVVKNRRIYYYKGTVKRHAMPLGVIRMDLCVVEASPSKPTDFDIKILGANREYNFRARDERERNEWVLFLRKAKKVNSDKYVFQDLQAQLLAQSPGQVIQPSGSQEILENYLSGNTDRKESDPFRVSQNSEAGSNSAVIEFDKPDTEENIRLNSEQTQIKAATPTKLIEKLTEEKQEMDFVLCFLLTYRSFTTPETLLNACIQRFRYPPSKTLVRVPSEKLIEEGEPVSDEKESKVIHPTQLRVCTVLLKWLEVNFSDFVEDNTLTENLLNFIENDLSTSKKFSGMAVKLQKLIRTKLYPKENITKMSCPEPDLPVLFYESGFEFIDLSPLEVARQMSLIEFDLFKQIQPKECLKKWSKKDEHQKPKLSAFINRFNTFSNWVQSEILSVPELMSRAGLMTRFIEIAQKCFELNNYNGTMEILSALNSSPVFRLQKTWEALPPVIMIHFNKMKDALSVSGNSKNYRDLLHSKTPPLLPYFGVYLTDLTFADDGNVDRMEDGLVNFNKNYKLFQIIREISLYQGTPYSLQPVEPIRNFLLSLPATSISDSEAFELSLKLEPRESNTSEK